MSSSQPCIYGCDCRKVGGLGEKFAWVAAWGRKSPGGLREPVANLNVSVCENERTEIVQLEKSGGLLFEPGIYIDRIAGGYRHHCHFGGDAAAGIVQGQGARNRNQLHQ